MIYETIVLDGAIFHWNLSVGVEDSKKRRKNQDQIRECTSFLLVSHEQNFTQIVVTSAQNEKFWTSVFQITYCILSTCHILHDLFSRPDPITSSSQTPKGHPLPLPRRELRPRRAKQHQSDAGQSVDCHKPMPQTDFMPCELPMICEISNSWCAVKKGRIKYISNITPPG